MIGVAGRERGPTAWLRRLLPRREARSQARASDSVLRELEREISALLDAGEAAQATRHLVRVRRRFPKDPEATLLLGDLFYEAGAFEEAAVTFESAATLSPNDAYPLALCGVCAIELGDIEAARASIDAALALDPRLPEAVWWRAVLHDLDGESRLSTNRYRQATKLAPERFELPYRVTTERFQQMAERALRDLDRRYEGFSEALERRNVALRIQDVPTSEQIVRDRFHPLWLGVFEGHAGADVSLEDPWSGMPGLVILFQRNLERDCRDAEELFEQIHITLLHEIAHAHGREEEWMDERGLA